MRKIKLFEEFSTEPEEKNVVLSGDDELEIDIDITPEDEKDMADESEELDEAKDPLVVDSKDIRRIQDIMTKSDGNMYKAKKLAETMAKLITDKFKAVRRARAAEREGQPDLADIFTKRAVELGAFGG